MRWIPPLSIFFFLFAAASCPAAHRPAITASTQPAQTQSNSAAAATSDAKDKLEERARIQMAEKRFDAAIQSFSDLSKADPKNAYFLNMIGIAYLDLNKDDQARKYFIRATKADKKYSSAINNLGMVYYREKDFKRAIREYQKAAALDPDLAGSHANLGFAYYNSNKFPEAAAEFLRALEIDPAIFERNDKAGSVVQDRTVNNHGLFFFTMAKVYAQKNDAPHCAEYLRKSLDEGYKDLAKVSTDPAFKDVVNDPDVQAVLARAAPAETKGNAAHPGA